MAARSATRLGKIERYCLRPPPRRKPRSSLPFRKSILAITLFRRRSAAQQLQQSGLLFRSANEVERMEITRPVRLGRALVADQLHEQFWRSFAPGSPNNIALCGSVQVVADLGEPCIEKAVPLLIGANAKRFEVPTVFAIVLYCERGPKLR